MFLADKNLVNLCLNCSHKMTKTLLRPCTWILFYLLSHISKCLTKDIAQTLNRFWHLKNSVIVSWLYQPRKYSILMEYLVNVTSSLDTLSSSVTAMWLVAIILWPYGLWSYGLRLPHLLFQLFPWGGGGVGAPFTAGRMFNWTELFHAVTLNASHQLSSWQTFSGSNHNFRLQESKYMPVDFVPQNESFERIHFSV